MSKDPIKLPDYERLPGEVDSPADLVRRLREAHQEEQRKATTEVVWTEAPIHYPIKSA